MGGGSAALKLPAEKMKSGQRKNGIFLFLTWQTWFRSLLLMKKAKKKGGGSLVGDEFNKIQHDLVH